MFGEKVRSVWANLISKRNNDGTYGLPFCVEIFNDYMTLAPGDLILICAETGKGKSAYSLNETIDKLKRGVCVLYIDTELDDETFLYRAIAHLTGIDCRRVQTGQYGDEEAEKIQQALRFFEKSKLIHEYVPDEFNKTKIEQLCRKWKTQADLGLVIYDYIKPDDKLNTGELANQLGKKCDFLKNTIAGKLKVPVIAGAQLNSRTKDIADSDKLARYASTVIKWRPKTNEEISEDGKACGNFCVEIGKNRNGASTGEGEYIDILFHGDTMTVRQADKQHVKHNTPFE